MLRLAIFFATLAVAAVALPRSDNLPEPGDLAFDLNEEEFEDYLDQWLGIEERNWVNPTKTQEGGCDIRVNGDLGEPQPVYLNKLRGWNEFLDPTGATGSIHLDTGEEVIIACTGSGRMIRHPNILDDSIQTATAKCVRDNIISGEGWLSGEGQFIDVLCSSNSQYEAQATGETCFDGNIVIRVGFVVEGEFKTIFHSCFDQERYEVLYVWYEQRPQNSVHQTSVSRPGWLVSSFFSGVGINNRYTQVQQAATVAQLLGSEELAAKYVTSRQYLARGHLAAKTDFVFATGQRATFFFINAAPQWQPFNAGNWNWVEQNLRQRIGAAGYQATVYTGTFGFTQLRDVNNTLVDIYLYWDANNNPGLPVPLYFYKVVYEPSSKRGTAFVGINNPYYSEEEVKALAFCTDRCRNNSDFSWLNWQPDRIDIGYSFCCDIDEFRKTIPHLPEFPVEGLLY